MDMVSTRKYGSTQRTAVKLRPHPETTTVPEATSQPVDITPGERQGGGKSRRGAAVSFNGFTGGAGAPETPTSKARGSKTVTEGLTSINSQLWGQRSVEAELLDLECGNGLSFDRPVRHEPRA